MDMEPASYIAGSDGSTAVVSPPGYGRFSSTDTVQLAQQTGEWQFEVTQLSKGPFDAEGTVLALDGVSLLYLTLNQTVLQRGYGPPNMVAVFLSGAGSAPAFAYGQLVEPGQCVTVVGGELEGVTHRGT